MTGRRVLTALAALLLLSAILLPGAALAEDEVVLTIGTIDGASGDEVELEIEMNGCEAVDSLQFNLNYDPAALKVLRVTPGTVFPAEYCVTNTAESGRVRAACVSATGLSDEDGGTLMIVKFRLLNGAGSVVSFSDVVVTRVDGDYNQSRAYLLVTDGGVTAGGGALPAPVTTPWIAETPVPTPSPTPEPTAVPTPAVFADETPVPTIVPEEPTPAPGKALLPYLIVGVFAVLAAFAIVIILIVGSRTSRRKKKRRRKKKKNASRR